MKNEWTLVLPMVPPSLNIWLRYHWAKRNRLRDEWHTAVWVLCNEQRVPAGEKYHLETTIFFHCDRKRDVDNFTSTVYKLVLDGLVRCGVLLDDTAEHVTFSPVVFDHDREHPRTEVKITSK